MKKFFLRFHEGEDKLAEKFARALPEHKIGMANIQEYLIKNHLCPKQTVRYAKTLLQQNDELKEMSISEWLHKLNLSKYVRRFTDKNVNFVEDVGEMCVTDGRLNEMIHFRKDE